MAQQVDQPIAALLTDLKARGLFDDTLVLFTCEFGRTPFSQGSDGRDHNPTGFSLWLAGGGVKRGFACKLKNWWELKGVMPLANRQFPTGHGSHATPSEIAITQWGYPDAIKSANYAPQVAPTNSTTARCSSSDSSFVARARYAAVSKTVIHEAATAHTTPLA